MKETPMHDTIYYVYAICRGDAIDQLPADIYPFRQGGLTALVGYKPVSEYGPDAFEANVQDTAWLERAVIEHQQMVSALREGRELVPMRFGTVFLAASGVETMLRNHGDMLSSTLKRLEGCDEWGVRIWIEQRALDVAVGMSNEMISRLREDIEQRPGGVAFMLRKQLDRLVASEAERLCDECARESHGRLRRAAAAAISNALPAYPGPGQIHLLNGAYLVAREEQPAFAAVLQGLCEQYGTLGFRFETSGPWPAYHFVSM
jgi:hypothetical protein